MLYQLGCKFSRNDSTWILKSERPCVVKRANYSKANWLSHVDVRDSNSNTRQVCSQQFKMTRSIFTLYLNYCIFKRAIWLWPYRQININCTTGTVKDKNSPLIRWFNETHIKLTKEKALRRQKFLKGRLILHK